MVFSQNNFIKFFLFVLLFTIIQKPSFAQESVVTSKRQVFGGFKIGLNNNFVNKQLFNEMNERFSEPKYKLPSESIFTNLYVAACFEYHLSYRAGIQTNIGYSKSQQKFKSQTDYVSIISYRPNSFTEDETITYEINNFFVEVLPEYIYKRTRFFGGLNVTNSGGINKEDINKTNNTTGETEFTTASSNYSSYNIYSVLGVAQGFKIKNSELILTASYYGLLRKYESGFNISIGILF
jgi:hypothetical protein